MTAIVYKGGILAVDRMVTFGDTVMLDDTITKLKLLSDPPVAIATSAAVPCAISFCNWYASGRKEVFKPDPWLNPDKDFFTALVLTRNGLEFFSTNDPIEYNLNKYYAIGSGRELALGALWQGASAIDAVRAANEHSLYCGFGVVYVDIKAEKPTLTICPK